MIIKNSEVNSSIIDDSLILKTIINAISPKIYDQNINVTKRNYPISVEVSEKEKISPKIFSGIRGIAGEKGDKGDSGSGISAEQIRGIEISDNNPLEDQVLLYDGEKYIPKYYSRQIFITLTESDIYNGYTIINVPASGTSGEKAYIELKPKGLSPQFYGKDFTAMNIKDDKLIIIWKISGEIVGITNPIYPTEGMNLLVAGDILQIKYNY
jgi:hypothetical protein